MWTIDNSPFNNAHGNDVNSAIAVLSTSANKYK